MTNGREGSVVSVRRYPVKSMLGEALNAADVTERGLLGDRVFGLVDAADGKVASAKNPRKWPRLFDFRAAFTAAARPGAPLPTIRITLPGGAVTDSTQEDCDRLLSEALGRPVRLETRALPAPVLEEYWPDIEGMAHREAVTDEATLADTFFDLAFVHLLTTATLDRLRDLYPAGRFEASRFRPNLVVDTGADGFAENDWIGRTVVIGEQVRLKITRPCGRCVMTTLAQDDLPRDVGILCTAVQHNHGNVGVYAEVLRGGAIRRGDEVRVT
jgi:uncharacterized protein